MTRTLRSPAWIVGIATAALLVPAPTAAVPDKPPGEGTDELKPIVDVVEKPVRVPVDDTGDDIAEILIAAALGAILATVGRRRTRLRPEPTDASTIDITETVTHRSPAPRYVPTHSHLMASRVGDIIIDCNDPERLGPMSKRIPAEPAPFHDA